MVGLLSAFAFGRDSSEQADVLEFLTWLSEHNFDEIRQGLEKHQKSTIELKIMLSAGFGELNQKLDKISQDLASFGRVAE